VAAWVVACRRVLLNQVLLEAPATRAINLVVLELEWVAWAHLLPLHLAVLVALVWPVGLVAPQEVPCLVPAQAV